MANGDIREHAFNSGGRVHQFKYREGDQHATWWSFYDEQVVRDRHWHISPGDVVLDGGAAFGSYAIPALAMGAKVICFSPADYDTGLLTENVKCNPELSSRCLVVRDGLHERDGWFDPDHSVFAVTPVPDTDQHAVSQWLRVRSLDSFIAERGIDRIDWLKLDVEGAELAVLKGAVETLRRHRPKLLIECHNFHYPTMEQDVAAFVGSLGLGYQGEAHPHGAVSHAFFEVK